MAVLVLTCPHCAAQKSNFVVSGQQRHPTIKHRWSLWASCGACGEPICAVGLHTTIGQQNVSDPASYPGNLVNVPEVFSMLEIFPKPIMVDIPTNIPDNVARVFKQAVESGRAGHFDAACGMYRRAMELALKAFSPDVEAWKLEKRIDKLAAENKITVDLRDWAHELRLDGNEALHSDAEATVEMTEQMHGLCKFLLIYLYTLPKQVADTKARRQEN